MTWEIAAAWAGVIVTAVFGFLANYRSAAAKKEAGEALAASQSMALSLDKIAAELARPRRAPSAAGPALGAAPGPVLGPASAQEPGPAWNVEYRAGQAYALRNVGVGTATHVRIATTSGVARNLPADDGVTLEPGQAHGFVLTGTSHSPTPTDLLVTCTELGDEHVPVPPRPH